MRWLMVLVLLPFFTACVGEPMGAGPDPDGMDPEGTDAGRMDPEPMDPERMDPEIPEVRADDTPQFLTWDGGSGPTRTYWNRHLKLRWETPGTGDWLDRDGVDDGDQPYATAPIEGPGTVELDATELVARWIDTGENRGFYLRSDEPFAFVFAGRTSADEAARPVLEVRTDAGSFTAPALANASWSPSTSRASDSRERFQISRGNHFGIVLFDLGEVSGIVEDARLVLTVEEAPREGNLEVFEADPPEFRVGGGVEAPVLGIAEDYPHDEGIDEHPSVVFAGDFSDLSVYSGRCTEGGPHEQIPDPETGSVILRGVIPEGSTGSTCNLSVTVARGGEDGTPETVETALYARYHVYLESDWGSTVDANKMPGWDMRMGWWNPAQGGYWQSTTGNGGSRGTGLKVWNEARSRWEYEGHSIRGHGGAMAGDDNYYDHLFWLGGYVYHLDQEGPYGTSTTWHGSLLARERWTSIEQYVQVNSIEGPFDEVGNGTAVADGIYRIWVDGVPAFEATNMRWSRHPELGLQGFWFNWYHGGTSPTDHDMHYRMSSVVIAREYIGPRRDG